jgi:hypothetical protein
MQLLGGQAIALQQRAAKPAAAIPTLPNRLLQHPRIPIPQPILPDHKANQHPLNSSHPSFHELVGLRKRQFSMGVSLECTVRV